MSDTCGKPVSDAFGKCAKPKGHEGGCLGGVAPPRGAAAGEQEGPEEAEGNSLKTKVGMPAFLYLHQFGSLVWDAFGSPPYLVGSALRQDEIGPPRDIDVRLILEDGEYEAMGLGDPKRPTSNAKWVSLVMAYSALGRSITGGPIDFQIQQQSRANEEYPEGHLRSVLGLTPYRMQSNRRSDL